MSTDQTDVSEQERTEVSPERLADVTEWDLPTAVGPLVEQLAHGLQVGSVFGDPIETEAGTIIPVAKGGYGTGFGGGVGEPASEEEATGSGGGWGGGISVSPAGYIEITDDDIRYVSVGSKRRGLLAFAAGLALGAVASRLLGGGRNR
ncbi:spore germination protein GerW family protein [Haloarculaceae archaeon H-GB11]|nr:spore germination protein GerW family protein [Haloarculaceae archaeon H-GB11]